VGPLILGVWATPGWSLGIGLLAVGFTGGYVMIAMRYEETGHVHTCGADMGGWWP